MTLAFASVSGCTFHGSFSGRWYSGKPDPIFVTEAPPAPRTEVRTACKGQKVWVFGYWDWQSERWQWVSGGCRTPEPAGSEWVGPVLTEVDGGFELTPGHWAPRAGGSGSESSVASRGNRSSSSSSRSTSSGNTSSSGSTSSKDDDKVASSSGSGSGGGGSRRRPRRPIRGGGGAGGKPASSSSDQNTSNATTPDKKPARGSDRDEADLREADRSSSDKRPSRPRRPIRGGMASAANSDRSRGDSDLRKPAAGGSGKGDRLDRGDRSDQEGMAEAEGEQVKGASFSCKLSKTKVKPGDKLEIKIRGKRLKGKAKPVVKLGRKRLKVRSRTSSLVRTTVPKSLRKAGRVTVTYRGERVACGRVRL